MKQTKKYPPNRLLRQARLQRGWSQQHLADLIDAPGSYMVNRWEQGHTFPSQVYRDRLVVLFHQQPQALGLIPTLEPFPEMKRGPVMDPMLPIPSGSIPLVGREALLARIQSLLCTQAVNGGVALHGLPGVGKTTAAVHLALNQQIRAHFGDGVLWAGLGPQSDAMSHLLRWTRLLDRESAASDLPGDRSELVKTLRQQIGARRLLIILDDAWKLEDALSCRVGGPQCGYLLTTRFPEIALRFALQQTIHVPELSLQAGTDLLLSLSPALQHMEREQVQELVQAVGGLPLALVIMGTYLLTQSYHQQPRRLQQALTRLQQAQQWLQLLHVQAGVERDERLPQGEALSLQAVIGVSVSALDDTAQQALWALAALPAKPQSFSEEAALAVAETTPETLDRLVDAGLVETTSVGRYCLHQTIAEYSKHDAVTREAELRLIAYVTRYVQQHHYDYDALEREESLIQQALAIAPERGHEQDFLTCVCAVAPCWHSYGLYVRMEPYLLQARSLAQHLRQEHTLLTIIFLLSSNWLRTGRDSGAITCLQEGIALARHLQDRSKTRLLLSQLGHLYAAQGCYDQADDAFQEALALSLHDPYDCTSLWNSLAMMQRVRGNLAQAEAYAHEGLLLTRHAYVPAQTALLLRSLGSILQEQGAFEQATTVLGEALRLARMHQHGSVVMVLLLQLGRLALIQDDYSQAEAWLQEALVLAHEVGIYWRVPWQVQAHCLLGLVFARQGRDEQAQEHLRQGKRQRVQPPRPLGEQLVMVGEARWLLGNRAQAARCFKEGYLQAKRVGQALCVCQLALLLGLLLIEEGDVEQAQRYVQEGVEHAQNLGMPLYLGIGEVVRGEWLRAQQRSTEARSAYQESLRLLPASCRQWHARAYEGLAHLEEAGGSSQQARRWGEQARCLLDEIGHRRAPSIQAWLTQLMPEMPQPEFMKGSHHNTSAVSES